MQARLERLPVALTREAVGAAPASARPSPVVAERRLLDAIRRGDERQAPQVYASLLPAVQTTLLRVLGGPDRQHRELTQRSIEQVIAELVQHPSPWLCRLDVWATTSAARVALDVLRARMNRRDVEVSWGDAMAQPLTSDAHVPAPGSAIDRLRWLLAELPPQQAEAIVLCDVMGLEPGDVAVTSGVGVDPIRRRLAAGHARLARQMAFETSP
jgi:DNA-directed RNA polymerase specialized sigma24 family protein